MPEKLLFQEAEEMISLSNIVKQGFVINNVEKGACIIDSDLRMKEKYGQLILSEEEVKAQRDTAASNSSGATNEEVENLEKDIDLDEVRLQAQKIIDDATNEADDILINANEKALKIYEEQKEKGYAEGMKGANDAIEQLKADAQAELEKKQEELEQTYLKKQEEMEKEIVDVVTEVFEKVFGIQFAGKKDMLLYLVQNTIQNVEPAKEFRIRVSTAYRPYFEEHLSEIQNKVGIGVNIEILNDASLDDSQCLIETSTGVFDCGIDTQLSNLIRDIRSLAV